MLFDPYSQPGKVLWFWFRTGVLLTGLLVTTSAFSQQERGASESGHSPAGICANREDKLWCVQELVAKQPGDLELRRRFVMMLIDRRETQRALEEIDTFLLREPSDSGMRRVRAGLLESIGDFDAAQAERGRIRVMRREGWDRLLSDDAPDPRALLRAANVAHVRQELQISQRLYERYFAIVSEPPLPVLRDYASLLHSQGKRQAAIATLTLALNRAPPDDFEHRLTLLEYRQALRKGTGDEAGAAADAAEYTRVMSRYKAWRADQAKRRWRRLLKSSQRSNAPAILNAAMEAAAASDFEAARELYERYFEWEDGSYLPAILGYAGVLKRLKEYREALSILASVEPMRLEENPPGHADVLELRALIKSEMGNTEGARADRLERREVLQRSKEEQRKLKAKR